MPKTSNDPGPDRTLEMVADPYRFIARTGRRKASYVFQTRFLLKPATTLRGAEGAALFYDTERFERTGAMPAALRKTLLGEGGVQGLDGAAHRHRKAMFMDLMTPDRMADLAALFEAEWRKAADGWSLRERIVLYDALQEPLTRAATAWAGVPLFESEARRRARDLTALFDKAGALGPGHLRSRWARRRADKWMSGIVEDIRSGRRTPPANSAAHAIAWHRDPGARLLPARTAAVELLNIVRPIVAVSVYVVFLAHALQTQPEAREALSADDPATIWRFVQEVRRFYPFFPAVAAKARSTFEWKGHVFPRGRRVILDLYGTDHDEARWPDPNRFRPDRFQNDTPGAFDLVPQGGGDHRLGHRCAGEWATIAILEAATRLLAFEMRYVVPRQDLRIDMSRLPALPRDRIVLRDVAMPPRA